MSHKRRRTTTVVVERRQRRPIDKKLVVINQTSSTTQVVTTLLTVTFPITLTGLRWMISWNIVATTATQTMCWAIVVVRDGLAANTMSSADGTDFYTPESDVLMFGVMTLSDTDLTNGPSNRSIEGSTKTMRKMQGGDALQFISLTNVVNGATVDGIVQFFQKS